MSCPAGATITGGRGLVCLPDPPGHRDALLVPAQTAPPERRAMVEDTPYPQRIPLARRFNLDDFSTKIGQETASKRPGDELADFEDAHPIKGPHRDGVGGCHSLAQSRVTKMQLRIRSLSALLRCPFPVVSSTSNISPAPMTRDSPSLAVICTPLSRLMMYCRRGAGCQSRS